MLLYESGHLRTYLESRLKGENGIIYFGLEFSQENLRNPQKTVSLRNPTLSTTFWPSANTTTNLICTFATKTFKSTLFTKMFENKRYKWNHRFIKTDNRGLALLDCCCCAEKCRLLSTCPKVENYMFIFLKIDNTIFSLNAKGSCNIQVRS